MYTKLKKIQKGFTIVETLIVLAIAALILIIVLIAVPDLQRSARNSDTTTDAQNIASGISSFEGNNDGSIPANVSQPVADGTVTITGTGGAGAASTAHIQASETISDETGSVAKTAAPAASTDGTIIVDFGADCPTGLPSGNAVAPTADSRGVAILYEIETSSSAAAWNCVQE